MAHGCVQLDVFTAVTLLFPRDAKGFRSAPHVSLRRQIVAVKTGKCHLVLPPLAVFPFLPFLFWHVDVLFSSSFARHGNGPWLRTARRFYRSSKLPESTWPPYFPLFRPLACFFFFAFPFFACRRAFFQFEAGPCYWFAVICRESSCVCAELRSMTKGRCQGEERSVAPMSTRLQESDK